MTARPPLHGVLLCHVHWRAYTELLLGDVPPAEHALDALRAGLAQRDIEIQAGRWWEARKPVALAVPFEERCQVQALAAAHFLGDARNAAGWLIARGLGFALPLPTREEQRGVQGTPSSPPPPLAREPLDWRLSPWGRPRAKPRPAVQETLARDVPDGQTLAAERLRQGLSQRDFAAACGYTSRGQIAEIERGRRSTVHVRLHMAKTLARLAATCDGADQEAVP